MRLQRYLAISGLGSRRSCEKLMGEGRVAVNGLTADRPGMRVLPGVDEVTVDGITVRPVSDPRYILLNKPPGYITSLIDPHGRPTIVELLPEGGRLFPAGRLDFESRGLILVTNDGHLANRVTHPSFGLEKGYVVTVEGRLTRSKLKMLRSGIELEEGITTPARVTHMGSREGLEILQISIHQGWKRQIRRMCRAVGLEVHDLLRNKIGPLSLKDLPEGSWRDLSERELEDLKRAVGL